MAWHAPSPALYRDRRHGELARRLGHLRSRHHVVVLALPRGGVPVVTDVAGALDAPLDMFVVRQRARG